MKVILAATDFSIQAGNAVKYAAELANISHSKLVLLYVYQIPIVGDVPMVLPVLGDLEEDFIRTLENQKQALINKFGQKLNIECVARMAYSVEYGIKQSTKDYNVDLVVMGMKGANYLTERLIGSETTTLIKNSDCPVLVVNEDVRFNKPGTIILAFDYEKKINKKVLAPLRNLALIFNSKISVVNINTGEDSISNLSKTGENVGIEKYLTGTNHSFHAIQNKDVVDGINSYTENILADMVVIISHKHTFLETIFKESNTKKMAFHTSLPLLVLPDKIDHI
jgi:nucleotide-binding universal stress UspA family protein